MVNFLVKTIHQKSSRNTASIGHTLQTICIMCSKADLWQTERQWHNYYGFVNCVCSLIYVCVHWNIHKMRQRNLTFLFDHSRFYSKSWA